MGLSSFIGEDGDEKPSRVAQLFDLSSASALVSQAVLPFAFGNTLVLTYFGFTHPKFIRAIDYYDVSELFVTGPMVDAWIARSDLGEVDLSCLEAVVMPAGDVSPERMEEYREFFLAHKFKNDITVDSGASEAGDTLLTEMESRSAYGVFNELAATPDARPFGLDIARFDPLAPWKMFVPEEEQKQEPFSLPEIPEGVMKAALKYGNRIAGIPHGRKHIEFDFED